MPFLYASVSFTHLPNSKAGKQEDHAAVDGEVPDLGQSKREGLQIEKVKSELLPYKSLVFP